MKNTKTQTKEIKILIWLMLLTACLGTIAHHGLYKFTALADDYDLHSYFPRNENKPILTNMDRVLITIVKNKAVDLQNELICTLWDESFKICKNPEFCVNGKGNNPVGSVDRGACMYNSYWRKDVNDECAFNIECCVTQMIKDFRAGKSKQWYGYCKT